MIESWLGHIGTNLSNRGDPFGLTTLREIAEALNARGVRTARGGQWHSSTVHDILARFANREP